MEIKTNSIIAQTTFSDCSDEYKKFEEKFKPKKTTDDCYTPENIYNAVADWAAKKYGFDKEQIVRPFWPGKDYRRTTYPSGCVVVDNPPFSIIGEICKFYNANGVRFFLFSPALTIFKPYDWLNYICAGASVVYANGAVVNTSFVTNFGEFLVESAPDLYDIIKRENDENVKRMRKEVPKYEYPPEVVTAARTNYLSVHHTPWALAREDALFIRRLDDMPKGDAIFGGGFLLSERAAAERAAAERAAAERAAAERAAATKWRLSERERELQKLIGRRA